MHRNRLSIDDAHLILNRIKYKNFRFGIREFPREDRYWLQSTSWVPDRDMVWPDDPGRDDVYEDIGFGEPRYFVNPSFHLRYPQILLNVNTITSTEIQEFDLINYEQFLECVRRHIHTAEDHEIDEFFMIDGYRPFDPHRVKDG